MLHIYCGGGKGKTTAAMGLVARMAGNGGRVLIVQFLKGSPSGEITFFEEAKNIKILRCDKNYGFTFQMSENDKAEITRCHNRNLEYALDNAGVYDLIILDEIFAALNGGLVDEGTLKELIGNAKDTEIVMTGRDPHKYYTDIADYISEIRKIKHPFDGGVSARRGIEF